MRVRVLGTAAGGGSPQWNCACEQCRAARGSGVSRTQDSVLISGDGESWFLLNASPDVRAQILAAPELTPGPGRRETPLRGVILTDAELDHVLGLFQLREASSLDVFATAPVLEALPMRGIVDPYGGGWNWRPFSVGTPFSLPGMVVSAFLLGSKKPRYAAGREAGDWVVGLRIGDFVYAPCFGEWTGTLDEALRGARVALIDGTFLDAEEMPGIKGHLPISESAPHLARHPGVRFLLTHLNNTNPLLTRPGLSPIEVASEMELLCADASAS